MRARATGRMRGLLDRLETADLPRLREPEICGAVTLGGLVLLLVLIRLLLW